MLATPWDESIGLALVTLPCLALALLLQGPHGPQRTVEPLLRHAVAELTRPAPMAPPLSHPAPAVEPAAPLLARLQPEPAVAQEPRLREASSPVQVESPPETARERLPHTPERREPERPNSTAEADQRIASLAPILADPGPRAAADETPAEIAGAVCLPGTASPATDGHERGARFGDRLAAAALAQTEQFVIYSARYRRLAFPMGDLAPFYGACTDVVVRAYRALGIDLQQLVHEARVGSGDPSVDHRRTEVLRKFFTRYGESLPVSPYPEDYRPGDIVTYERPFSRVSRSHVAIVAEALAPSGRPMIIHNRGWGPQLEDALFADRITGHYRFEGAQPEPAAVASTLPTAQARLAAARRMAR